MHKIAILLPLLITGVTACANNAQQRNDATGQGSSQTASGGATDQGCSAYQTMLADGSCADYAPSCGNNEGPCSNTLIPHTLTGCFAANYKAPIKLGDGQTYHLSIDTGSSNLAVASSACKTCSVSPTYTPGQNATNDNANVTSGYADGSGWSGATYTDMVNVDDAVGDLRMGFTAISTQLQASNASNVFFGASQCDGTDVSNTKQGILGMGGSGLTTAPDQAFMDVMKQSSSLPDAFSVQFCDTGGRIWYGGYDPNFMTQPPQFIPMDTKDGFYRVTIDDVAVNGTSLGASQTSYGPSIADTGTGAILLPNAAFDPLIATIGGDPNFTAHFPTAMLSAPGQCVSAAGNISRAQLDATLPTLTFVFGGTNNTQVRVTLAATSSYLLPLTQPDKSTLYCSTLGSSEALANQATPLLGNPLMHSQITIFDRDNARLGFAPQRYCQDVQ